MKVEYYVGFIDPLQAIVLTMCTVRSVLNI